MQMYLDILVWLHDQRLEREKYNLCHCNRKDPESHWIINSAISRNHFSSTITPHLPRTFRRAFFTHGVVQIAPVPLGPVRL